jgi:hypothetical protein
MPTTTKMGIVYPASTDLVKDGATAMGTISTTVDSKTGLVLISTTSFSAVSSISLANNTFTSSFRNYRIIVDANASTGSYIQMRMRASGTDNTSGAYASGFIYQDINVGASNPTKDVQGTATGTSWYRIGYFVTGDNPLVFDLFQPQIAAQTFGNMAQMRNDGVVLSGGFYHTSSTSFDALTVYPTSGTITGSIKVYGYNQ